MEHAFLERQSMMVDGRWCDAAWAVEMVDGESGELTISVSQIGVGGKGMALRMSMQLARRLRAMAGFGDGSDGADGSDCYDCRTTGERLTELEEAIQADIQERFADRKQLHSLANRLDALEALAAPAMANREWMDEVERQLAALGEGLTALKAWQTAVAQDGDDDDTLFRIYDTINRAERAKAAGGA